MSSVRLDPDSFQLSVDVPSLLAIQGRLSAAGFRGLLMSLMRITVIPVEGGEDWGWASFSQAELVTWGLGPSAAKTAASELRKHGFVLTRRHSVTQRQYAVVGPEIREWLGGDRLDEFRPVASRKVESPGGGSSFSDQREVTSKNSSSEITTSAPALELFWALQGAPVERAREALSELFSQPGSAAAWEPWRNCRHLGPVVGTVEGFTSTVAAMVADPSCVREWCREHGIQVAAGSIGSELAARVVFALVSGTSTQVRKSPAGWVAHLSKPGTKVVPSKSAMWVVSYLERAAASPVLPADEEQVAGDVGLSSAVVLSLPARTESAVESPEWEQMCDRIPSLRLAQGSPTPEIPDQLQGRSDHVG